MREKNLELIMVLGENLKGYQKFFCCQKSSSVQENAAFLVKNVPKKDAKMDPKIVPKRYEEV